VGKAAVLAFPATAMLEKLARFPIVAVDALDSDAAAVYVGRVAAKAQALFLQSFHQVAIVVEHDCL